MVSAVALKLGAGDAVERSDDGVANAQLSQAAPHLGRGPSRERQGQGVSGLRCAGRASESDPTGQDRRLARPGPGYDRQRRILIGDDRGGLRLAETIEHAHEATIPTPSDIHADPCGYADRPPWT